MATMDLNSLADKHSLQNTLSCVKNFARNSALSLLLFSLVFPALSGVINTRAEQEQTPNQVNPNTKVTVEITRKGETQPEVKEITLEQLQTNKELANVGNFNDEQARPLNLTPEKIEQIESKQGIFYEKGVAVVQPSILVSLGYKPEQISLIQDMADFYNSRTVKEIKVVTNRILVAKNQFSLFTIQAHAGCQYEYSSTWHVWGVRNWINNCMIQDLKVYGFGAAGLAAIFAGFPGQIGGFITGLYIELIDAANSRCDNRGAYLDKPYIGPLLINNVC